MTSKAATGNQASAAAFMQRLRHDHAGLSRMLRAIDGMVDRLATQPGALQPVLVEAFAYLLHYQHGYHHPREDRLFERIRGKQPALADILARLAEEHRAGQGEAARLAEDLAAATPDQLRGKKGVRLVTRIQRYLRHARLHMRNEEAVFYARAEKILNRADWAEIVDDDGFQDPLADMDALVEEYPELAAHFDLPARYLGQSRKRIGVSRMARHQILELTDLYGGLMHEGFDLTRRNANRLLAVRGPLDLLRAATSITSDSLRFVGQCVARPSRWAINTGSDLLLARIKPAQHE